MAETLFQLLNYDKLKQCVIVKTEKKTIEHKRRSIAHISYKAVLLEL